MSGKREPTEAEALESILRHLRGLAAAVETYAQSRLGRRCSRITEIRDSGTHEATPKS